MWLKLGVLGLAVIAGTSQGNCGEPTPVEERPFWARQGQLIERCSERGGIPITSWAHPEYMASQGEVLKECRFPCDGPLRMPPVESSR